MRCVPRLLLALCAMAPWVAHAQISTSTAADDIRAGREALRAEQPALARTRFAAALSHPDDSREDTFAAALGLGRADVWLGDYAAGARAFRVAQAHAGGAGDRQAADTGLAQALNALGYPHQAYALVAPFARDQPRATLELMRALEALGWQDKSAPYLAAAAPAGGYLGNQYRLLQDAMRYATAPRVAGELGVSHDSEGLTTLVAGTHFDGAPMSSGSLLQRWGGTASTTRVSDSHQTRHIAAATLTGEWRIRDANALGLELGMGRTGRWHFLQGAARWTLQPNDSFSLNSAVERTPVLTDNAIAQRLAVDTYSVGSSLRASDHWYVLPGYARQAFSDGNHRQAGSLRVLLSPWDIPGTAGALGAQLSTRLFHGSQPSRGVYFNPAHYRATQVGLLGAYALSSHWKLRASADAGRQWIDGAGAGIYAINATLQGRLAHNGRLDLQWSRSSAASVNGGGSGYWNNQFSVSLSYPL